MSSFITRLADRAVRLAAPVAAEPEPGLEVIEGEVLVPASSRAIDVEVPRRPRAGRAPAESRGRSQVTAVPAAPAVTTRTPAVADLAAPSEPARPAAAAVAQDGPTAVIALSVDGAAEERPTVAPRAATSRAHADEGERVVVVATAAPIEPVWPAAAARATSDATPLAADAHEPAVRVHIGRVDVRSAAADPAKRQPTDQAERGPELSLTAYLRGERPRS